MVPSVSLTPGGETDASHLNKLTNAHLGVLPRVQVLGSVGKGSRCAHYVAVHVTAPAHRARSHLHDALSNAHTRQTSEKGIHVCM